MSKTVELAQTSCRRCTSTTCIRTTSSGRGTRPTTRSKPCSPWPDALRDLRERNKSTKHLRFRPWHLPLPRQLHPHPLLLRLRLQPAGPRGAGPRREEDPDRPRRDRPRDGQHGVVHGRRHRHPRRHVHPARVTSISRRSWTRCEGGLPATVFLSSSLRS